MPKIICLFCTPEHAFSFFEWDELLSLHGAQNAQISKK